jgi:hypothetical protein
MLGALSADEEQILVPNVAGQPLVYDFFGLGQLFQMPFHLQFNGHGNDNEAG